jgi:transposase
MIVIGIDPHKSSHTAAALDTHTHSVGDRIRIDATVMEYRRLLTWAKRVCEQPDERRWAIENAEGLGRHLTQWLLARGEAVVDVPATATARVRELSRGGKRKTDALDAAAAASVAAAQGDAKPVAAEGVASVLKMLDERRRNLTQQRTRWVNQLHALLRSYCGTAPLEVSSGDRARHRLSRHGDRQLNNALHTIALTQVRMPGSRGRAYYDRTIARGKTHTEAMRCLRRRLTDHVWRTMISDERRMAAGPGGQAGATLTSSAAGLIPEADSSEKPLPGPATVKPTTSTPPSPAT